MVAACTSGKSGGSTCGNPSACGGDLVGTWTVKSNCFNDTHTVTTTNGHCSAIWQLDATTFGSLTINSDMSYSWSLNNSMDATTSFPSSCVSGPVTNDTCSAMGQSLLPAAPGTTPNQVFCSVQGQNCECQGGMDYPPSLQTGTVTTSNGVATFTPSNDRVTQISYCVSGTQLTTSPLPFLVDGGVVDPAKTGTVTYAKQ
jgi:hypothetical protein